jgi:15-cis-phytoene synthase
MLTPVQSEASDAPCLAIRAGDYAQPDSAAHLPSLHRDAWRRCTQIARAHGRTFFLASHALPPDRRRAIHAIYAFCRIADDIVDHATDLAAAASALDSWERQVDDPDHPVAIAFAHTRTRFGVPASAARELLAGVRMDLTPTRFATWEALRLYSFRVAGTVGLMVAPILGCQEEDALPHAIELGIAMQLTNILRDIGEDARRGRLYLPLEDLRTFGCDPESILSGRPNGAFAELIAFEIARARNLYDGAWRGLPALSPSGRLATLAGGELYAMILTKIEERDYEVFSGRAQVPMCRKLGAMPRILTTFARASWFPPMMKC